MCLNNSLLTILIPLGVMKEDLRRQDLQGDFGLNSSLFEDAIAWTWGWLDEAMSFRRPVSNCWKAQSLDVCFGIDTSNAIALPRDMAVGID